MFEEESSRRNAEISQWRERAQIILEHARRVAEQAQEREIRCMGPEVMERDRSDAESRGSGGAWEETGGVRGRTGDANGRARGGTDRADR